MSGFQLIVAEKPSVARDIARTLGLSGRGQGVIGSGRRRVSWCIGHLAELAEPASYDSNWRAWRLESLPMLPEKFKLQARKDASDQWAVLRGLLRDPDLAEVVNACDAGREGELIFAHCYQLAGCKAPTKRLWISSMTESAIRQGFESLRSGESMANLEAAARCRSEADWLVGLNATRSMTLKARSGGDGALLSLGRVQTPTLALLVEREDAIDAFVSEPFWQVVVDLEADAGRWKATWVRGTGKKRVDRVATLAEADSILEAIRGQEGRVSKVERKKKNERPPLLFDLTALQKDANARFRFSAARTLELTQALYENHKLVTYPRTDSRHLTRDQVGELPKVVKGLSFGPYQQAADSVMERWPIKLSKRVVDDSEVSDHHAIIPTGQDPRSSQLNPDEKRIYDRIARRTLAVMLPDAVFATASVETEIADHRFAASGRTRLEAGWQVIDPPKKKKKEPELLPPVEREDATILRDSEAKEGQTKPPRRHSEATLLGAMERAGSDFEEAELKRAMKRSGLGTPATRAAVIETLLSRKFIERQPPSLVPTPRGRALISMLPVPQLRSAKLTGRWEARLAAMAEGEDDRATFMADVRAMTGELVAAIVGSSLDPAMTAEFVEAIPTGGPVLGTCPRCSGDVVDAGRSWACPKCRLRIGKQIARRPISARMAKTLLEKGHTKPVKGFKSRANKEFAAALKFDADHNVVFDFPEPEALGDCPTCGKPVRRRGKVWTCESGRECSFVVFGEMSGCAIPEEAVRELLEGGQSATREGFFSTDGKPFFGGLELEGGRVVVRRRDPRAQETAGRCPKCGAQVRFARRWSCGGCPFSIPAEVASRPLTATEVGALLEAGRTPRLHGFRQKSGAVFKAALYLDDRGAVQLDFSKPTDTGEDLVPPPGGPPFAFGRRLDCAVCVSQAEPDPGYVIAGRAAWGCSHWRRGCKLRVPFAPLGVELGDEQARRLLGKHHETVLMQLPVGIAGAMVKGRFVLVPEEDPCWRGVERT